MEEVWLGIGLDPFVDYTEHSVLSRGASTIDKCNPVGLLVVYFIHSNFYQSFFKKTSLSLLFFFTIPFFSFLLSFSFVFFSLISVQCGVLSVEVGGDLLRFEFCFCCFPTNLFSTPTSHLIMRLFISTVLHEIEMGQLNQSLSHCCCLLLSHIHSRAWTEETNHTNKLQRPHLLAICCPTLHSNSSGSICFSF